MLISSHNIRHRYGAKHGLILCNAFTFIQFAFTSESQFMMRMMIMLLAVLVDDDVCLFVFIFSRVIIRVYEKGIRRIYFILLKHQKHRGDPSGMS